MFGTQDRARVQHSHEYTAPAARRCCWRARRPRAGGGADGEAGGVVEDVDHPCRRSVGEGDLRAVYLPQVVRCEAFEASPLGHGATLGARSMSELRCSTR